MGFDCSFRDCFVVSPAVSVPAEGGKRSTAGWVLGDAPCPGRAAPGLAPLGPLKNQRTREPDWTSGVTGPELWLGAGPAL